MTIKKQLLTIVFTVFFCSNVFAAKASFGLGFAFGGDRLVTFTDGTTIDAGDGIIFSLDLSQKIFDSLAIDASVGYKFKTQDYINGTNTGTINLNSIPVTLGAKFIISDKFNFVTGGITQLSSEISANTTVNFDTNVGFYSELNFLLNKKLEIGIRSVTGLTSTVQSSTASFDASHFAIIMRSFF